MESMFMLWYLSESDLLNPREPYSLSNTGQGLNRVQQVNACRWSCALILRPLNATVPLLPLSPACRRKLEDGLEAQSYTWETKMFPMLLRMIDNDSRYFLILVSWISIPKSLAFWVLSWPQLNPLTWSWTNTVLALTLRVFGVEPNVARKYVISTSFLLIVGHSSWFLSTCFRRERRYLVNANGVKLTHSWWLEFRR